MKTWFKVLERKNLKEREYILPKNFAVLLYSLLICSLWGQSAKAQTDTLDYTIKIWSVNANLEKTSQTLDSSLTQFQLYKPFFKYQDYTSVAYNGNLGMAAQSHIFLQRKPHPFLFFNAYTPYFFNHNNTEYYNTKQAYTQIQYTTNFTKSNNLQNMNLVHTQNVLPYLNFGLQYRMYGADGEYMNQKTKSNALRFFGSLERPRYTAYWSYNMNNISGFLNGGITVDSLLNPSNTSVSDNKLIPVALNKSKHKINSHQLAYQHQYLLNKEALPDSLGKQHRKAYRLGQNIDLARYKRTYELKETTRFYQSFYQGQSPFYSSNFNDSTGLLNVKQELYFQVDNPDSAFYEKFYAYYQSDYLSYHSFSDNKWTLNQTLGFRISNTLANAFLNWTGHLSYTFAGYNRTDYNLEASVYKCFGEEKQQKIHLWAELDNTSPDYFLNRYSSNFFKWDNDFKSSQKQGVKLSYEHKKYHLELGVDYHLYSNFIYWDSVSDSIWTKDTIKVYGVKQAYPVQNTATFGLLSAFVQHQLNWGAFHMKNSLVFQKTSDRQTLHLPNWSWYNSTYFEMRFYNKVLILQVGLDTRYNSAYYTDAFMPATGLFYNQNELKQGDYPYVDVFINARIKRVRLFFKMEHVNQSFMDYDYFPVLHHPSNPRVFRFGLSWVFYN